jgi:hypothetical protein
MLTCCKQIFYSKNIFEGDQMKKYSKIIIMAFTISVVAHSATFSAITKKIFLFDTTSNVRFQYKPFIEILKSLGIYTDYRSFSQISYTHTRNMKIDSAIGSFFIIGPEFLNTMQTSSVSKKILKLMEEHCKVKGKIIGLFFPPMRRIPNFNILQKLAPIFFAAGLPTEAIFFDQSQLFESSTENKNALLFAQFANNFLQAPIESRPLNYHTTLNLPHQGYSFEQTAEKLGLSHIENLKLLPEHASFSDTIKATLPYGLYWFNAARQNHILISFSTVLSFSGITENFQFCPANFELRQEINSAVQQMLWEILQAANKTTSEQKPTLPKSILSFGQNYAGYVVPDVKKIGWMEIEIFNDNRPNINLDEQQNLQTKLIDDIFAAQLDSLWITFNPQQYFSKIARNPRINGIPSLEEKNFLGSTAKFTQKLKETANNSKPHKKLPKIFVGIEIANNLYPPNTPKNHAIDFYGNEYSDVPAPLDRNFWKSEIKDSVAAFLKEWHKPEIGHNLPIAGIVLDLEMYGRKTSSSFTACMGFEPTTFAAFVKQSNIRLKLNTNTEIVSYLMQNPAIAKGYFKFLESDARVLGNDLRLYLHKKIPRCRTICYAPNVPVSWFYKGLLKGLSTTRQPLPLFTFNAEFAWHANWLKKNEIYVSHSSVLMLSKLRSLKDFAWVDEILQKHNGAWINRFSRFVENYDKKGWSFLEQTPLSEEGKASFFNYLANTN